MAKTNETKAGQPAAQAEKPAAGAAWESWATWAESQDAARLAYQVVQTLQGEDDLTFDETGIALGFGLPKVGNAPQKAAG